MSLTGKVAVITGGGTGIGFGIASVLSGRGMRVVLAQKGVAVAERALAEAPHIEGIALEVDIASRASVDAMVGVACAAFGRIDLLVNNASLTGPAAVSSFLDCSEAQLDEIVDVNLKGTFHCSQAVARRMVAAGHGGSIVHIASVGAFAAQELASVYCATKAAQASLAQSMALELAPHGIRVNAVAPGDIYTPANAAIVSDLASAGATGKYLRTTPLGRRGTPEDIGHAVAFLASDEASFVTGTTLTVDGGFLSY
ncbi:MAG: SDR family oxidoreductase [Bryobacterales bacterium]|nr:SDR family oxidoreductase [Bryobacterales bacterium]